MSAFPGGPCSAGASFLSPPKPLDALYHAQRERLHTLELLDEYLADRARGRCHQLVTAETRHLRQLYESVWADSMEHAPIASVISVRHAVETYRPLQRNRSRGISN